MNKGTYKLYCLGSRGSWPVEGHAFNEFGGNTTCYVLKKGDYALVIDAGTGLYAAKPLFVDCKKVDIILTHVHYDHILGLLDWGTLPDKSILTFYGNFEKWVGDKTIDTFFGKPFWPAKSDFGIVNVPDDDTPLIFNDELEIRFYDSNHPNFSKEFIIRYADRKMVVMFDNEKSDSLDLSLIKDADLLLYDGMYTDEIYPKKKGYGHSTYQEGVKLAVEATPNRLIITHHDPLNEDTVLNRYEKESRITYPYTDFARSGQVWEFPFDKTGDADNERKKKTLKERLMNGMSLLVDKFLDSKKGNYYILFYSNLIIGALIGIGALVASLFTSAFPKTILFMMAATDLLNALILYKIPKSLRFVEIEYMIEKAIFFMALFLTSSSLTYACMWLLYLPTIGLLLCGIVKGSILFAISEICVILALNTNVFQPYPLFDPVAGAGWKLPVLYFIFYLVCLMVEAARFAYEHKAREITKNQEVIIQKQTQELRDQNYSLMMINNQLEMRNKLLSREYGDLSDKEIVDQLNSPSN